MRMSSRTVLIDLHMHTTFSDGVWSKDRLLSEISDRELDFFSISDHDGIDAYPLDGPPAARCIPALEVDSHHGGHTVHLLAYGVTGPSSPLLTALREQREARKARMAAMVEAMQTRGADVCLADVEAQAAGAASLGRPHLARALLVKGIVASAQEAFDRYLADEGEAYVALERLTSACIIELIHRSGGVAVVAHPVRLRTPEALDELLDLGADGIEVVHPTADAKTVETLTAKARERGLLITGGTDFHAPVSGRPIGVPFDRIEVERLMDAITQRAAQ